MGKITGFLEYNRELSKEVAPLERITNFNEFHIALSKEKQKQQGARCMDCGVPFCQNGAMINGMTSGCPLNNLIPEWNHMIFKDHYHLALQRLLATNRFPEFTSRACPAPCEAACTCGLTSGEPVTVRENEYAIIEEAYQKGHMKACPPPTRTEKTVAVVGSGPAGLATAEWLNKRGHNVTIFEKSDRIGGLLMYGIPNMKIEKWTIDRRVKIMKEEGIIFKTNCDIGKDITGDELKAKFDAVVLCCGASLARDIDVPGRQANGIHMAVDYLSSITKSLLDSDMQDGKAINANEKNVLVIGGGDTGNDCVGSAMRQGCNSVVQLEMMPKLPNTRALNNAWPQWPLIHKTDYGQAEAIAKFGNDPRKYQTTVKEFIVGDNGDVTGAIIEQLVAKTIDGRTTMVASGKTYTIDVDMVFIAAGFIGSKQYVVDSFGAKLTDRNNVLETNYRVTDTNVFVAGDMRRGQSLIVWALREGRDVARIVDTYLMGYSNL